LQAFPRILGRHYLAIFVLASATLSYQILITRFFSVMLYYHFAFAAISLAMLGLTRGAMLVYDDPVRYAPERVGAEFARHASWFAITGAGAMIVFLCVPLVVPENYVLTALAIATIGFVRPFTESGVCITLLLTRLPYAGGWLYAADLAGAALAVTHDVGANGNHRHPHSVVRAAAGTPGILHGDDVPPRLKHLAPAFGAASVFLERQWDNVDVRIGAGHGLVD
jgi:hypothetical protein